MIHPRHPKTSRGSCAPHRDSHRIDCRRSSYGCCAGDSAPAPEFLTPAKGIRSSKMAEKIVGKSQNIIIKKGLSCNKHGDSN